MKTNNLVKLLIALPAAGLLSSGIMADTSEQLATCKAALKATYGENTRVRMYGTKSYRGVTTLKLKVSPKGQSSLSLQCSSDVAAEQQVVLKDKNGEVLGS
jgi:hypothetical protein